MLISVYMMMLECRHGKAVDLKFQKLALRYYKQPTNQVRLSPCINKAMNQKRIKAMDVRNNTPVKKWKLTCVGQCLIWSFKVSLNRSYPRNCDPCRVIGLPHYSSSLSSLTSNVTHHTETSQLICSAN